MSTAGSEAKPMGGTTVVPPILTVSWEPKDRHLWMTLLAFAGVLVAAALAAFGLPPVDLHPFIHDLGIMDPLCGGTRSARYTAQGDFGQAWNYNPLGILTVLGGVLAVSRALVGLVSRKWLTVRIGWTPRRRWIAVAAFIILVTALEIRQQLRADLLMAGT